MSPAKKIIVLLGVSLCLSGLHLRAQSTTGPETITFGPYSTSNWRSDDFKGTAAREWDAAGKTFSFAWKTEGGDQIGRVGITYGSPLLGTKISGLRPGCVMSTEVTDPPVTDRWFYWAVYGWTHPVYTPWGNTPHGWDNEFYVVMYTQKTRQAFLADPGCVDAGSVSVDGQVFDCYHVPRASQSQWLAVRRANTWSASVDLKKIFDYWRSQGLGDEYVVDLGWALEGFNDSAGKLELTNVHIPDLSPPAAAKLAPSPTPAR